MTGERALPGADENLARAAALVQAHPIRWLEEDTGAAETDVTARGWFQGVDECARILAARADIENAHRRGASLEAQVIGGHEVTFGVEGGPAGWLLTLRTGDYVLTEIRLDRAASTFRLSATLDPRVDAPAPGMRGRLIFDLRSDLVALGEPAQNR